MITGWFEPNATFTLMDDFRRRMQEVFEDLETGRNWTGSSAVFPRANLYDDGDDLVILAELPGVSKEDIQINGSQEVLTITGERKTPAPEGYTVHRRERAPLKFSRTFRFPVRIDADKTTAELKNGLLTVRVPKAPELKPRSITVHAG
jgi:HSP20 family protein